MAVDYHKYMASREWALKREAVKKRANGICERCQGAPVQNVHHLTYKHLGNEPLTDLQGVCIPCHEFLSAKRDYDPADAAIINGRRINGLPRVYCAGKIYQEDWRTINFGETVDGVYWDLKGDVIYTGPKLYHPSHCSHEQDNHNYPGYKCFNGPQTHGLGLGTQHLPCFGKSGPDYQDVFLDDLQAIRFSDCMFAWLDSTEAYGTIAEIGFAYGLGLPVFLYSPEANRDLWFVHMMGRERYSCQPNVYQAWDSFIEEIYPNRSERNELESGRVGDGAGTSSDAKNPLVGFGRSSQ